jgi:hypothetical protein
MSFLSISCFALDNGRLPFQITGDQSEQSTYLLFLATFVLYRDPTLELDQRGAFHMARYVGFPPSPTLCPFVPTWILPSQRLLL